MFKNIEDQRNYERKYRKENKKKIKIEKRKYYQKNKKRLLEKQKKYHKEHRDSCLKAQKNSYFKHCYKLSLQDIHKMLSAQKYKCAICKKFLVKSIRHIDHNHSTGKVRGILCARCNLGLGYIEDTIFTKLAHFYLNRYL